MHVFTWICPIQILLAARKDMMKVRNHGIQQTCQELHISKSCWHQHIENHSPACQWYLISSHQNHQYIPTQALKFAAWTWTQPVLSDLLSFQLRSSWISSGIICYLQEIQLQLEYNLTLLVPSFAVCMYIHVTFLWWFSTIVSSFTVRTWSSLLKLPVLIHIPIEMTISSMICAVIGLLITIDTIELMHFCQQ